MSEVEVVIDKQRLFYEGLFSMPQLYILITEWFEEKEYDSREIKNIERTTPSGKYLEIELIPWKKVTDYIKNEIRIRIIVSDLKDVEVEREGAKIKLQHGKVRIVFDGYTTYDYDNRWESKPTFFLIRTLFDKYFYKPYSMSMKRLLKDDFEDLFGRIKAFLNLYKY